MDIDFEWLEEHVLLCKLNNEDRTLLEGLFELSNYSSGDEIVTQGEPGGELYLLRSGRADITCMSAGQTVKAGAIEFTSPTEHACTQTQSCE